MVEMKQMRNVDQGPIRVHNGLNQNKTEFSWLGLCKNFDMCGHYLIRERNFWKARGAKYNPVCWECYGREKNQRANQRNNRKPGELTPIQLKKKAERLEIEELYLQGLYTNKEYKEEIRKHTARYRKKLSTD